MHAIFAWELLIQERYIFVLLNSLIISIFFDDKKLETTKMKKIKDPLQILQIWFSSSFPIGSYAYSHGLEALIDGNKIINGLNQTRIAKPN